MAVPRSFGRLHLAAALIAAILSLLPSGQVHAAGHPHPGIEHMPPAPTGSALAQLIALHDSPPVYESQGDITIQAVVFINWVKVAGDDEWQAEFGTTWKDKANNAIERADDEMYVQFGIDLRVWTYKPWDTWPQGSRGACSLVNELASDIGIGSGGDTVAGFSATRLYSGAGCSIAFYSLIQYQGNAYTSWVVTQHEYSHLYDVPDRYPDPNNLHTNDVMEDPYNRPDFWCTDTVPSGAPGGYAANGDHGRLFNARDIYE
jgi:hypothetical protein